MPFILESSTGCWSPSDVFTNLFLNTSFSASLNYSPFMGFIKQFSSFLMWLEIDFYVDIIISRWKVSWNVSTGVTALLHMTGASFHIIGIYLFLSQLNWHEFEQTLGDSEGQGCLKCCSPWDLNESDMTEQLNNNNSTSGSLSHNWSAIVKENLEKWIWNRYE